MAPFSFSEKRKDSRPSDKKKSFGPKRDGRKPDSSRDKKPIRKSRPERPRRESQFREPEIPLEIKAEDFPRRDAFQFQSLAEENADRVARHLLALNQFLETDPERAFLHGQAAAFRAGRVAIVRERAGIAALAAGHYQIAQKDLRAASRISGSKDVLAYIAQCELALGNPRKTLEIAGSVKSDELSQNARVEMRIAAAGARSALGELDAAVVTLQCSELQSTDATWSRKLHRHYRDALVAAGRKSEAESFESRYPQSFVIPTPEETREP